MGGNMKRFICGLLVSWVFLVGNSANSEPIFHEVYYPAGDGPFPGLVMLHTSGGYKTILPRVETYVNNGYAVYTPDFFRRHKITSKNRFETWTTFRKPIEKELVEILSLMQKDPKVDPKNLFTVGYSNGGYWATFLAAQGHVNAGVSTFGVWSWPKTFNGYPAKYLRKDSNPVLALHGKKETVQRFKNVVPQINKASSISPTFKYHYFDNAGHSWDCRPCKKDGFNSEVTAQAVKMTLDFFKTHRK
jgi:dienelactone hydrolase